MGIAEELLAKSALALLPLPRLGECNEEALVAGIAIDHRRLAVPRNIAPVSGISGFETAEISEIFAERKMTLDVNSGDRLILVELRGEPLGLDLVLCGSCRSPPVAKPPQGVELAALVVEGMPHFMADGRRSGLGIIDGGIG